MKPALLDRIHKSDNRYYGVAMRIPVVTRERKGRSLDKAVEVIIVACDAKALDYAKKLLQRDAYEPLEEAKCKRVYVGEIK